MSSSDGRVVVITGAGQGIGREEALLFAREGARVVVNDVNADNAHAVVEEIVGRRGEAVANTDDISDWDGAASLSAALDSFGGLDTLVNNAGILRDRMFVNMTLDDWDAVMKVHLRGTFAPTKHAVTYWRAQSKAGTAADGPDRQHQQPVAASTATSGRPTTAPPRRASRPSPRSSARSCGGTACWPTPSHRPP